MMFDNDYLLDDKLEIESAKRYREIAVNGNYSIKEFVDVLSDFSIYYLFENMRLIICYSGVNYYRDSFYKALINDEVDKERSKYRRKVYFLLKTSKYDDGYVEDNIEKYIDILMSFCVNFHEMYDFYFAYDGINRLEIYSDESTKKKIRNWYNIEHIRK
ncbi:MAG: hypothetical protein IKF19_04890 [Bacilli bacterium]|nr:hypothetical protein [Bacilli bacterium]